MAPVKKIRLRKRFQRARFGRKVRGAGNPKQRVAAMRRAQTRRTRGR